MARARRSPDNDAGEGARRSREAFGYVREGRCWVGRPHSDRHRPFVAVAPLVKLEEHEALEARRGRRPRYAHLPAYENGRFCVDLDRITTIETGVLLRHPRISGLSTDRDRAAFGKAVARKFGRFPFPDDLPRALARWRDHVVSKHDRENSPEGRLYHHALDVRLSVQGSWDAEVIDVTVSVLLPPGFLPPTDPDTDPEVGSVEAITSMPAADIAQRLCDGVSDPTDRRVDVRAASTTLG